VTEQPTRASRRAELRRRRRRRRVQLLAVVLAVLAALAVAFAVYLAREAPDPPSTAEEQLRTQQTMLFQVAAAGGDAAANALLAHDPETQEAGIVLVPPQVLVTVPGTGSQPLGRVLKTVSAEASRTALSDLLGVTVDDSWVLTASLLQQLIDAVGGVAVEVDVPVVRDQVVAISPGAQTLDGARAVQFLSYLAPGDQEQVRLARLQEVLDGLINALPPTSAELATLLQGLGPGSTSTLEPPALADFLLGLAAADEEGQLQYDTLPVVPIETGSGGLTAFRVDQQRLPALVERLLAQSVPPGVREGGNRVLVLNGVGTPGLGEAVRAKLAPAGFVFVGSQNAPAFGHQKTQILVPEATPEAQALGERVAKALGVPPTAVATQDFGTVADVVVLVGADFKR
jgi:anionic cell wall polymer biosynthesis LytR-Cps2A-Psr (LCP) family protein